jgi:DEAD/DEAH box helicase
VDGAFSTLHPDVAAWCDEHLGTATPPQAQALPLAGEGRHALICSPTGTGKTLAAFLPVMSRLADLRDADELLARTYCLYVSPLRALGYDVEHNLRRPLRELRKQIAWCKTREISAGWLEIWVDTRAPRATTDFSVPVEAAYRNPVLLHSLGGSDSSGGLIELKLHVSKGVLDAVEEIPAVPREMLGPMPDIVDFELLVREWHFG